MKAIDDASLEESSPTVEESSLNSNLETSKLPDSETIHPLMTNKEVAALLNHKTENAVRGRHTRREAFHEKGHKFTPVGETGKPRWKVEMLEDNP